MQYRFARACSVLAALASCALPTTPLPVAKNVPALPALVGLVPPAIDAGVPLVAPPQIEAAEPSIPQGPLDGWALAAREDGVSCREALKADGFKFRAGVDRDAPDKEGCGIPHPVVLFKGPTGVTYDPPINVDCALARSLGNVERIAQEEAQAFSRKVVRIGNLGGFACRPRNFRKGASLSAHSFGSAADLSVFHFDKGPPAVIVNDYAESPRTTPAREQRRAFLRAVFSRMRREADLTYAVGPDFNAVHKNHFHLDRGGWKFLYP